MPAPPVTAARETGTGDSRLGERGDLPRRGRRDPRTATPAPWLEEEAGRSNGPDRFAPLGRSAGDPAPGDPSWPRPALDQPPPAEQWAGSFADVLRPPGSSSAGPARPAPFAAGASLAAPLGALDGSPVLPATPPLPDATVAEPVAFPAPGRERGSTWRTRRGRSRQDPALERPATDGAGPQGGDARARDGYGHDDQPWLARGAGDGQQADPAVDGVASALLEAPDGPATDSHRTTTLPVTERRRRRSGRGRASGDGRSDGRSDGHRDTGILDTGTPGDGRPGTGWPDGEAPDVDRSDAEVRSGSHQSVDTTEEPGTDLATGSPETPTVAGVLPVPLPDHGRAGRNLPAAIAVGALLGGMALASLFTRPEAFVALVSLVVIVAVWELAGALAVKQIVVPVVPLAVGSLGMLVSAYVAGEEGLLVSFTLTGFGILLWRIIDGLDGALRDVTAGLFSAAYIPLLAGFAIVMLADVDGPERVVTFIAVTVASDIGGYVAGVTAGRHPMAPGISPKKSWEGFAGSVLFCLAAGVGCVVMLLDGRWWVGLVLGAAAALCATVGDLAESLIKRDLGIKDMGTLLPGHGGIMDRLDSLLPTAPVAYLILHFLVSSP